MADKDLGAMLERIAPLIQRWHLCDLPTERAAKARDLASQIPAPGVVAGQYADPVQALRAAVAEADPADRIVVFGSFYTVGGVLQDGVPRLSAKHVAS
jgi:dihydrofolate synthase/folylpolyglutamate synthase